MDESTKNIGWPADAFKQLEAGLNGDAKGSVHQLRKKGLENFNRLGIPTTKREDWKYTNIAQLVDKPFKLPVAQASQSVPSDILERFTLGAPALVFVNGILVPDLCRTEGVPAGVSFSSLQQAAKAGSPKQKHVVEKYLGSLATIEDEGFPALNTALNYDGAVIIIDAGAVCPLVEVLHINDAEASNCAVMPRILVVAETNSRASISEVHYGSTDSVYLSTAVTEVIVEDGAVLEHTLIQDEGERAIRVGTVFVKQGEGSSYTSNVFHFGGSTVRNEIHPVLAGERCESLLNGLVAVKGTQHIDNFTVLDHAMPNCFSREIYKGIYDDSSEGVFCGTIIVRPDAQKTNAIQSNQTLLLSPKASIESKPQLKIWADDVKCTHGATVGQLDDDALFYLRARGIPRSEAQRILMYAFAGEVIDHVSGGPVKELIVKLFAEKLGALGE